MTINYIDVGIVANDGTGDDLREAFVKVNDNFEELDLRIVEETVIINGGTVGEGIYLDKIDGEHTFKRIVAGSNITLSSTANSITVNAANSLDQLIIVSDSGTITVSRGQTLSVSGGNGIATRTNGQQLILDLNTTGIVSRDSAPQLTANLNALNNSIENANVVSANVFDGELQGNVWGYDVRTFGSYFQGFDFGQFRSRYNSSIEFIMQRVDVDLGAFDPESGDIIDLGGFVV
jgi:hypothetical protein